MLEGLERHLFARFKYELKISERFDIPEEFYGVDVDYIDREKLRMFEVVAVKYEHFKSRCRTGKFGENPRFWLMYMDRVKLQHQARTAMQQNDFDLTCVCVHGEPFPLITSTTVCITMHGMGHSMLNSWDARMSCIQQWHYSI